MNSIFCFVEQSKLKHVINLIFLNTTYCPLLTILIIKIYPPIPTPNIQLESASYNLKQLFCGFYSMLTKQKYLRFVPYKERSNVLQSSILNTKYSEYNSFHFVSYNLLLVLASSVLFNFGWIILSMVPRTEHCTQWGV